jgi:hypothetical protein
MTRSGARAGQRRHPLFARLYAHIAPAMEEGGVTEHRQAPLAGTSARVPPLPLQPTSLPSPTVRAVR